MSSQSFRRTQRSDPVRGADDEVFARFVSQTLRGPKSLKRLLPLIVGSQHGDEYARMSQVGVTSRASS
jgi:hypothetical protein